MELLGKSQSTSINDTCMVTVIAYNEIVFV